MKKRGIPRAWVEAVVAAPEWSEPDPEDSTLTRSYRAIPEFGGRVLRVVHRPEDDDVVVVTVHPDRGATKRRRRR